MYPMHNMRLLKTWIVLGVLVMWGSSLLAEFTVVTAVDDTSWLFGQINATRAQHGLQPLTLNAHLITSATEHSQYLAHNTWTNPHVEANGSTPQSRMMAAGYVGENYGENVYGGGLATVQIAFNWWLGSPIHYAGIVNSNYTDIGIGIASGPYGQFYTTDFGRSSGIVTQSQVLGSSTIQSVAGQAQTPSVVNRVPASTHRPLPTLTTTASLTSSQTFTPYPTATKTPSQTTIPATPTAIELEVSPLPLNTLINTSNIEIHTIAPEVITLTSNNISGSNTPVALALVSSATMVTVPTSVSAPSVSFSNVNSAGPNVIRIVIPILIGIQAIIFGNFLFRRSRSR